MEIKIEDLQVGDEVLIGSHMGLSRVKLLRPLKLSKKVNWKGVTPYSKVKCATNEGSYEYQIPGRTYIYTQKTTMLGDDIEYNKEKYIDFNYKNIWLIKRAEQWNKD